MAERAERAPRPEREHPIGRALYSLGRDGWGVYYSRVIANPAVTPERRASEKAALLEMHAALGALINGL